MSQDTHLSAALVHLLLQRGLITLTELNAACRYWEEQSKGKALEWKEVLAILQERIPDTPTPPKALSTSTLPSRPVRVLLVDDVKVIRDMIKGTLSLRGYTVVGEATDGQEAVSLYEKWMPDLIIMDIEMKGTNGLEAMRQIRKLNSHIPIVIMTGNPNKNYVQEALKWGATDFLTKPLDLNRLLEVLSRFKPE